MFCGGRGEASKVISDTITREGEKDEISSWSREDNHTQEKDKNREGKPGSDGKADIPKSSMMSHVHAWAFQMRSVP